MNQNPGQRFPFVRDFDMLDPRPCHQLRRIPEAIDTALVFRESLRLRDQESLTDVIVIRRAQQITRRTRVVTFSEQPPAFVLHLLRFPHPLAKPGLVVAEVILEPQTNTVDLADLRTAPWRSVEAD